MSNTSPTAARLTISALLLATPGALAGQVLTDPSATLESLGIASNAEAAHADGWGSFSDAHIAPTILAQADANSNASDVTERTTGAPAGASTTNADSLDESGTSSGKRLRTWELPAVRVEGRPEATLFEEQLVGSYHQPRWTATRRFPTTRVYVIPEGKVETELWARGTFKREGNTEWRFLQEVEIGLPGRFQIDLYLREDYNTEDDETLMGGQFELRWALADWGKIWGNPTLYFEYITLEDRPDRIEPKILFGGEITERWHWGLNLVAELELGGEREHEFEITNGISYTVIDSVFSVGVESILDLSNEHDDRSNLNASFVIGPSLQWRPVPPMTVNVAPLIGIGGDSPYAQVWFNMGWEF